MIMKQYQYSAKITEDITGLFSTEENIDIEAIKQKIKEGLLEEVLESNNIQVIEVLNIEELNTDKKENNVDKKIILYSTGCPKCKILKQKLQEKNITYTEETNVDNMLALGLKEVPWLKIDEKMLNFAEALQWINNL